MWRIPELNATVEKATEDFEAAVKLHNVAINSNAVGFMDGGTL
jgi:hypothetical protein